MHIDREEEEKEEKKEEEKERGGGHIKAEITLMQIYINKPIHASRIVGSKASEIQVPSPSAT